ncbi:MAG: hypothetical protein S4CHLAM6_08910 [Chlamydiae bacterium]|nr:hypothetical protein [Chlamydiota bacterium]
MGLTKAKNWIILYFQGMMMGVADLIPGVSGGTVAFILGLHPNLLKSLRTLRPSAIKRPKTVAWFLLTAVALGMVTMLALGSHAIYHLLNHNIYQGLLRALFMGLMIGSVYFCMKQVHVWNVKKIVSLTLGILVAFSISYFCTRYSTEPLYDVPIDIEAPAKVLNEANNYDTQNKLLKNVNWSNLRALYQEEFVDPDTWIFSHDNNRFLQVESCLETNPNRSFYLKIGACGALSIGAMILPGISGNQIMQIMGCYEIIIESIAMWTSGLLKGSVINASFWVLLSLGLGIIVGVATFSRVLIFFYKKYFSMTLAALVGFMIGSVPNLWPFWKVSYNISLLKDRYHLTLQRVNPEFPALTSYQTGLALTMVIIGIGAVIVMERKLAFKKLEFTEA